MSDHTETGAATPEGGAPTAAASGSGKGGLLGAAMGVAALMLLGNGLGFVRDMVLAALFGAGSHTDAFVVGWTVPETFSTLLLEGLLPLVLVPWLVSRARTREGLQEAVGTVVLPVAVIGTIVGVVVALCAGVVVRLVAPDIADPQLARQCVQLAAFTVPAMTLAGTLSAILRSADHLVLPAAVYTVYNIGIIATTVLLRGAMDVRAAALGLSVGAALMCLVQLPQVLRIAGRGVRVRRVKAAPVMAAMAIAIPTMGYLITRQAQVFAERFYGSELQGGAITFLNYAQKLGQFPVTLALSLALVSFPSLSRYAAEGDHLAVQALIAKVTRAIMVILVPAMAGVFVAARPVVTVAFGRGNFGEHAIAETSATLVIYSLGLFSQALVSTAALAHFAVVRKTWVPALWALACLVLTVVIDATTVHSWGTRGIALGNASGITLAAVGLYVSLARKGFFRARDIVGPAGRALAVAVIGAGLGYLGTHVVSSAVLQLVLALAAFVVAYGLVFVLSRGALVTDIAGTREGPEPIDQVESEMAAEDDAGALDRARQEAFVEAARSRGRYAGRHRG